MEDLFTPEISEEEQNIDITPVLPAKKKYMRRITHAKECPKNPCKKLFDFTMEGTKENKKASCNKMIRKRGSKKKSTKKEFMQRDIEEQGVWVQCSSALCRKWRYLQDITDPVKIPPVWTCNMHPDPAFNSCDKVEQDYSSLVFIHNQFTEGSVVWARMHGYPWWPALVETDPDMLDFMRYEDVTYEVTHYHVVFLDNSVSRGWVPASSVKKFEESGKPAGSLVHKGTNYTKRVQPAKERALKAMKLPIKERIQTFGFSQTFKGKWGCGSTQSKSREQGSQTDESSLMNDDNFELNDMLSNEDIQEMMDETRNIMENMAIEELEESGTGSDQHEKRMRIVDKHSLSTSQTRQDTTKIKQKKRKADGCNKEASKEKESCDGKEKKCKQKKKSKKDKESEEERKLRKKMKKGKKKQKQRERKEAEERKRMSDEDSDVTSRLDTEDCDQSMDEEMVSAQKDEGLDEEQVVGEMREEEGDNDVEDEEENLVGEKDIEKIVDILVSDIEEAVCDLEKESTKRRFGECPVDEEVEKSNKELEDKFGNPDIAQTVTSEVGKENDEKEVVHGAKKDMKGGEKQGGSGVKKQENEEKKRQREEEKLRKVKENEEKMKIKEEKMKLKEGKNKKKEEKAKAKKAKKAEKEEKRKLKEEKEKEEMRQKEEKRQKKAERKKSNEEKENTYGESDQTDSSIDSSKEMKESKQTSKRKYEEKPDCDQATKKPRFVSKLKKKGFSAPTLAKREEDYYPSKPFVQEDMEQEKIDKTKTPLGTCLVAQKEKEVHLENTEKGEHDKDQEQSNSNSPRKEEREVETSPLEVDEKVKPKKKKFIVKRKQETSDKIPDSPHDVFEEVVITGEAGLPMSAEDAVQENQEDGGISKKKSIQDTNKDKESSAHHKEGVRESKEADKKILKDSKENETRDDSDEEFMKDLDWPEQTGEPVSQHISKKLLGVQIDEDSDPFEAVEE